MRCFKKLNLFLFVFLLFPLGFSRAFSASAKIKEDYYIIKSALNENMVLDIECASQNNEAKVQLYESNQTNTQVFYISKTDDGAYQIEAYCSKKMLDVQFGGKAPETKVWQYEKNETSAQKWDFKSAGNGYFYINSKVNGLNMDVCYGGTENGTQIWTYTPNGTNAQKFKLEKFYPKEEAAALLYDKRNYATRLTWFEDKFVRCYSNLNAKNILVVGDKNFCDNFKKIAAKCKGKTFRYTSTVKETANLAATGTFDMILNIKYDPSYYTMIFGKSQKVTSFKSGYEEILVESVIEHLRENNVTTFFFESPTYQKIMNLNLNDFERNLLSKWYSETDVFNNKDYVNKIFGDNYECKNYFRSKEYCESRGYVNRGNYFTAIDYKGQNCNSINGRRLTTDAPNQYQNNIYLFGGCTVQGREVTDKYTISSFLQKKINKDFKNRYLSVNCGIENVGDINDFEYMLHTPYKPGDIVIEMNNFDSITRKVLKRTGTIYFELSPIFNRPHNHGHWFVNRVFHTNHNGNKAISEQIYKIIKNSLSTKPLPAKFNKIIKFDCKNASNAYETFFKENPGFQKFLDNLNSISKEHRINGKKIGSLNMNCNPFTLGHRYLIEQSLKKVDHLYLFVVEEDASDFSFKDRYEMIKQGTADLKNLTVLTTGKWMCSKLTFPEYFVKEHCQKTTILNPTKDIELFGKYIAPALGVTIRFAGEEPFDLITRQHNNFMKNQFPQYGVEFCEIPRKSTNNGQVISASTVRKLLKEEKFEELKKFVPQTIFDYLINMEPCD